MCSIEKCGPAQTDFYVRFPIKIMEVLVIDIILSSPYGQEMFMMVWFFKYVRFSHCRL